jgi:hypothetical protein
LFGEQPRAASLAYIVGKLTHGWFRYGAPLASGNRGFSDIYCREYLRPPALAFLPQGKGFLCRLLGPV